MGDNESAFASNPPELPELNGSDIDSNLESERKTAALRHYLRDLFKNYVDRQPLPAALAKPASGELESLKQILAKRHPDIIQKAVEAAAEKDLPVEAEFEHRHEIKGEASSSAPDPAKPKTKAKTKAKPKAKPKARQDSKVAAEQKARARLAAQKFVEPVAGWPMVRVAPAEPVKATSRSVALATRRAIRQSVAAALLAGLAVIAYLVAH